MNFVLSRIIRKIFPGLVQARFASLGESTIQQIDMPNYRPLYQIEDIYHSVNVTCKFIKCKAVAKADREANMLLTILPECIMRRKIPKNNRN